MSTDTTNSNGQIVASNPKELANGFFTAFEDGELVTRIPVGALEHVARLTKGVPNGKTAHKFSHSLTQTQLDDGSGFKVMMPDGSVSTGSKLTLLLETVDQRSLEARRDAKRWRTFCAEFKKRLGLVSSKIPGTKRVSLEEFVEWTDGERKIDNLVFDALPQETRDKLLEQMDLLAEKEAKRAASAKGKGKLTKAEQLAALRAEIAKLEASLGGDDDLDSEEEDSDDE